MLPRKSGQQIIGQVAAGSFALGERQVVSEGAVQTLTTEQLALVGSCHEREHCEWRLSVIPFG
jgi:hypothetical protein